MRFREQFEHHKIPEWYSHYFDYDRLKDGLNYFRTANHRNPLLAQYLVNKDDHGHQDHSGDSGHGEVSKVLLRGFYTLANKDNTVVPVNLEQITSFASHQKTVKKIK
jgi:hypothetical protein